MEQRPRQSVVSPQDVADLRALEARLNALLPQQYQHCYEQVQPVSMGSAPLKFAPDGQVAWNEIWTTFCDLALAGGPPHRGTLLEPPPPEEATADPVRYQEVVAEIGRGIWLTTRLGVLPRAAPGWVGVRCRGEDMASWLVRAIVAENVFARHEREMMYVPAGPRFRLDKEIKNIVTTLAKTCHYWADHLSAGQRATAADAMNAAADGLLQPASPAEVRASPTSYQTVVDALEQGIRDTAGLPPVPDQVPGWVGVRGADEAMAVWSMRAVIAANVTARREGDVLLVPASPTFAEGDRCRRVVAAVADARRLWNVHLAMAPETP
jgi:hypothetical protein